MMSVRAPATLGGARAATDVAAAAQLACLLEASAPKPGNVSPGRHFADARYEDFLASAIAIGMVIAARMVCSVMICANNGASPPICRAST